MLAVAVVDIEVKVDVIQTVVIYILPIVEMGEMFVLRLEALAL
jgi:hypothetical protein